MRPVPWLLLALCGCQSVVAPPWGDGSEAVLAAARRAHQDTVVFLALPGRDLSDRMEQQSLPDERVLAALRAGGFASVRIDVARDPRLYRHWVGSSGEGMGLCVLDGDGEVYAARPGPQDPPELAAWLRLCAARRADVQSASAAQAARPDDPDACFRLARLRVELGRRQGTEELLATAALGGIAAARLQLARLFALDGNLQRARQWLVQAPAGPARQATEGYVLFKERRHQECVQVLQAALQQGGLGDDRQRCVLFLGKALHECGRSQEALRLLEALVAEGTGSTAEGAACHTIQHIQNPVHGHTH